MKKILTFALAISLTISFCYVSCGAISFKNQENVPYSDKNPIETPHFEPILDCVWDEEYKTKYVVKETEKRFREGTFISAAWYGNTLYFFLFVPDTSPQDEPYNLANYMIDGPWFALYFGGDSGASIMWKQNRLAKTFKIFPYVERINYQGACFEESIDPPRDEDFRFDLDYREDGYVLELAYTVPVSVSKLHGDQEIAFDIEIYDVNEGMSYRYFLANHSIDAFENYCTAWGAKLVLESYEGEETDTGTAFETETAGAETSAAGITFETVPGTSPAESKKSGAGTTVIASAVPAVLVAAAAAVIISANKKQKKTKNQ